MKNQEWGVTPYMWKPKSRSEDPFSQEPVLNFDGDRVVMVFNAPVAAGGARYTVYPNVKSEPKTHPHYGDYHEWRAELGRDVKPKGSAEEPEPLFEEMRAKGWAVSQAFTERLLPAAEKAGVSYASLWAWIVWSDERVDFLSRIDHAIEKAAWRAKS